jgi:hypothetical protein
MMEDGPSSYYPDEQASAPSPLRWMVFVVILILGSMSYILMLFSFPVESMLLMIVMFTPMLAFFLYASYRWAQGRPIVTTDLAQDEKILDEMRSHALRAEQVSGLEMFRCPDCGMSFELVNATPVDESVVLCPICGVRLYIR